MRKAKVYIALLHYPMFNKRMDAVTTSVTNLDLHDIARAARTYDVDGFYVVHPSPSQQRLIQDILAYWQDGYGGVYNSDRREAFRLVKVVNCLDEASEAIAAATGQEVLTVATDAHRYPNSVSYRELKNQIFNEDKAFLLLFGTGWGMARELVGQCSCILDPVAGAGDYNHLSVRSAVSIILDRLLGEFWFDV